MQSSPARFHRQFCLSFRSYPIRMMQITDVCRFRSHVIPFLDGRRSEDAPSSLWSCRRSWPSGLLLAWVVGPRRARRRFRRPVNRRPSPAARSAPSPGIAAATPAARPPPPRPTGRQSQPSRISPEAFTITADDPGLQLLAAERRRRHDPRPDGPGRSGRVEPAGPGRDRAGGLSPAAGAGRGRDGHGAAVRRVRTAPADEVTLEPRHEPALGLRRGHRPDPDPAGLQHRRLPRQGRRPERLPPLALRLRPGGRLPGAGPRRAASGGSRGSIPSRACSWPRRPAGSPHGGGPRLAVGSPEYQTLLAWIRGRGARAARQDARGRRRA